MAWRWRIRHKLLLGLGLVVGIIALLLAGTLNGLLSYSDTMKSMDSKLAELKDVDALCTAVQNIAAPADRDTPVGKECAELEADLQQGIKALHAYCDRLNDTLQRHRDPNKGKKERESIQALQERFATLQNALHGLKPSVEPNSITRPIRSDEQIESAIKWLVLEAEGLREILYRSLYDRIDEAKGNYRQTLIVVISTSVAGVVLMLSLSRFFYTWVFFPVRDLQQGAGRVACGDFDHRIDVHSGDEMEDLARAFNDMTGHLREMYRDLEHQVNERSRQLVRSEHLASVGFLAAGVAHEINNPMASIAFCSESLENRLADVLVRAPADADTINKYLQMIQKAAFRCKEITQRLLEFSRSSERRREPTDLADLIQNVLDLVEHLPNRKGKQVVFEPHSRVSAWVNGQEINSVVLNLVVNALDSMDEGGTLAISLRERDLRAEMMFKDSGCGMTGEVLENIFEPFFTRSRTGKGTGLGLSISHRIISQHGGEIAADSAGPGHGSTFTVHLPLRATVEDRATRSELSSSDREKRAARAA